MLKRIRLCAAAVVCVTALSCGPLVAQQAAQGTPGVKRTILETHDVPGTKYESVLGIAEIAPNTEFPRHTHPGTENSYVVEGSLELNAEGARGCAGRGRELSSGSPPAMSTRS